MKNRIEFHAITLESPWNPMQSHEILGLPSDSMDFYGSPWNSMESHGIACNSMVSMEAHGIPWNPMELFEIPLQSMEFHWIFNGIKWNSLESSGIPWNPMGLTDSALGQNKSLG